MKIKKQVLIEFFEKVKMQGVQQIKETIFSFEKDGLKVSATSEPKQARVMAWLKKTAFEDYEEIGNVGLNDLHELGNVFKRFGEKITIKKEGNLLMLSSDNKKVDIELISESFLETDVKEPDLKFTDSFSINASKLNEIYKDVLMNKDATLTIETEAKKVKFSNTGKYKFKTAIASETCAGGAKVTFGQPIIDATNSLTGDLQVSIANDYPIKIIEKTDNSVVTVIVAPRTNSEE